MITKICNFLMSIIIVIMVVIAGLLFVPRIFGYETFAVISGSMEPNIPVGSIVYSKECTMDDLQVGDSITFKLSDNTIVTHRIYQIDNDGLITTKGDANEVEDATKISIDNIIGKVGFTLPFLGYISVYAKTPLGIAMACAVIFVILLLNFIPDIFSKENQKEN